MPATLTVVRRAAGARLLAVGPAAVDDDGHRLPGELLLEKVVELPAVTRHDEDVTQRHQLLGGSGRPEANVQLAKQAKRFAEMILGLVPITCPGVKPSETQIHSRRQRPHLELVGQGQGLRVELSGSIRRRIDYVSGDLAEQEERPRLMTALLVGPRQIERALRYGPRALDLLVGQ